MTSLPHSQLRFSQPPRSAAPVAGSSSRTSLVRMSLVNHLSSSTARILSSGSSSLSSSENTNDIVLLEGWLFLSHRDVWKRKYVTLYANRIEWQNNNNNSSNSNSSSNLLQKRLVLSSSFGSSLLFLDPYQHVARAEDDCSAFEILADIKSKDSSKAVKAKFSADSEADVKRWLKEISKAIEALKGVHPGQRKEQRNSPHTLAGTSTMTEVEQKEENEENDGDDSVQENKEHQTLAYGEGHMVRPGRALSEASRNWIVTLKEAHDDLESIHSSSEDHGDEDEENDQEEDEEEEIEHVTSSSSFPVLPIDSAEVAQARSEFNRAIEEMNQVVLDELVAVESERLASNAFKKLRDTEARTFDEVSRIRKEEDFVAQRITGLVNQEKEISQSLEALSTPFSGRPSSSSFITAPSRALQALLLRDGVHLQAASADSEQRSKLAIALSSVRKQMSAERERARKLESLRMTAEAKRKELRVQVGEAQKRLGETVKQVNEAGRLVQQTRLTLAEKEARLQSLVESPPITGGGH